MTNSTIDTNIPPALVQDMESAIKETGSHCLTRSKMLDIGLTVIFSDDNKSQEMINFAESEYANRNLEGYERAVFDIKNPDTLKHYRQHTKRDKTYICEYALRYVIDKIYGGKFQQLLTQYINCGGVLL